MRAAGTFSYTPRGRGKERKADLANVECWRCRKFGHLARACVNMPPDERRRDRKSDVPYHGRQRDSMAGVTGEGRQPGAADQHGSWSSTREECRGPEAGAGHQDGPWDTRREAADDGDWDSRSYSFRMSENGSTTRKTVNTKA